VDVLVDAIEYSELKTKAVPQVFFQQNGANDENEISKLAKLIRSRHEDRQAGSRAATRTAWRKSLKAVK
jgi:hypothetical protein